MMDKRTYRTLLAEGGPFAMLMIIVSPLFLTKINVEISIITFVLIMLGMVALVVFLFVFIAKELKRMAAEDKAMQDAVRQRSMQDFRLKRISGMLDEDLYAWVIESEKEIKKISDYR